MYQTKIPMPVITLFLSSSMWRYENIYWHQMIIYFFLKQLHARGFNGLSFDVLGPKFFTDICFTFLHSVFSYVSSNGLTDWMHSCIGCTCLIFLHYAFSNVSSNFLPERMHNRIGCICLIFLHYAFSNVSSNRLHLFDFSPPCVFKSLFECSAW